MACTAALLLLTLYACTGGATDPGDGSSVEGEWRAEQRVRDEVLLTMALTLYQNASGGISGGGRVELRDEFAATTDSLVVTGGSYEHPAVELRVRSAGSLAVDTVPGSVIAPDSMVLTFGGELEVRLGRR